MNVIVPPRVGVLGSTGCVPRPPPAPVPALVIDDAVDDPVLAPVLLEEPPLPPVASLPLLPHAAVKIMRAAGTKSEESLIMDGVSSGRRFGDGTSKLGDPR
ncbi:Hypothetical protein A7982_02334 [Minicystis rosea]|nr:Hypothetical protein A7982_02334 [Minicystis rosea]